MPKLNIRVTHEQLTSVAKRNKLTNEELVNKLLKAIIECDAMKAPLDVEDIEIPRQKPSKLAKLVEDDTYQVPSNVNNGRKFEPMPKKGKKRRGKRGGKKHRR